MIDVEKAPRPKKKVFEGCSPLTSRLNPTPHATRPKTAAQETACCRRTEAFTHRRWASGRPRTGGSDTFTAFVGLARDTWAGWAGWRVECCRAVLERGRAHRSSVGKKTAVGHVMKCLCGDIQYQLLPFGVSLVRLDVKDWCSLDDVKDQVLTPSTTSDSSQTPGRGSASCRSVWTRREAGMTSCT